MPIYKDINKISECKKNKWNYLVEMEWIIHYISYLKDNKKQTKWNNYEKLLKEKSMKLIKELWLDSYSAAWIIYVSKNNQNFSIEPVVYVKSINTLFYETACWSWVTALWMVEAFKIKNNINNLYITQPSGEKIKVSINYNKKNNCFWYAQIQWNVKKLNSWVINIK